jgi:hypothetical protein
VKPSVTLRLTNRGVVERERLVEEAAERLLRWRVYYDGRLIEKGSAAGVTRFETAKGLGTYQVFAGVEGPSGFMPVSNLLEYPLFPEAGGSYAIFTVDADSNGTPTCVAELLAQPKAGAVNDAEDADLDNDGLPDREEGTLPAREPKGPLNANDRQLLDLWRSWSYELKNSKQLKRLRKGGS